MGGGAGLRCSARDASRCTHRSHGEIDGAFFGTSFPHMFLQTYPSLVPTEKPRPFTARIFGFRLHDKSSLIQHKLDVEAGLVPPDEPEENRDEEGRASDGK